MGYCWLSLLYNTSIEYNNVIRIQSHNVTRVSIPAITHPSISTIIACYVKLYKVYYHQLAVGIFSLDFVKLTISLNCKS